jgi:hypothetical protein
LRVRAGYAAHAEGHRDGTQGLGQLMHGVMYLLNNEPAITTRHVADSFTVRFEKVSRACTVRDAPTRA